MIDGPVTKVKSAKKFLQKACSFSLSCKIEEIHELRDATKVLNLKIEKVIILCSKTQEEIDFKSQVNANFTAIEDEVCSSCTIH